MISRMNAAPAYAPNPIDINADTFIAMTLLDVTSVNNNANTGETNIALDGNVPANRVSIGNSIAGLNWTPGSTLALRWTIADITGQDNGLAIDEFSLTGSAGALPEPAVGSLAPAAVALLCGRRRRTR